MTAARRALALIAIAFGLATLSSCDDVCSTKAPLAPGTYTLDWHQTSDPAAWHADNYTLELSSDRMSLVETFDREGHHYVVTYRSVSR